MEIYSKFYHNNYGNYNFTADTQRYRYIFYVCECIQICMISGETLLVKADFNDQVYSNTRVPTQLNTSPTRMNTSQHE